MLAYLIIAAAVAFWLGVKSSRLLSSALNKHYARAFYISRLTIRVSDIGDCNLTTVAISTTDKEHQTAWVDLYGYFMLNLDVDLVALGATPELTRLCLHDFAMVMPDTVKHDPVSGRTKLLYRLPRQLTVGEVLHIWFFN